ncbi:unnamed protein product [Spirodela intermedia]|uniref:Uncharacterized protein n=2 Tax=Spirodela intermedia TaxID=51605 RepID=A0A7I8L4A4_SPIIN|nr:unnamed protein product [Spirodela intermedia]CAA6667940.1 unnamed protein product [Spirodela intermedia]CAA7404760.1 unnamed protein product [Spirodela intermedia]
MYNIEFLNMTKEKWDTFDRAFGTKYIITFMKNIFRNIMNICGTISLFHVTLLVMQKLDNLLDYSSCFHIDYDIVEDIITGP